MMSKRAIENGLFPHPSPMYLPQRAVMCVGYLQSTNSREEQVTAPSEYQSDLHNAISTSHGLNLALSTNLIETSGDATKTLSVDAKAFQPRLKLNVHTPAYDPFGNIVDHDSPRLTHEPHKWKEVLINDGILINEELETTNEAIDSTVDTSTGWSAEAEVNPPKHTPTTQCQYLFSPYNQWESYELPVLDGYSHAYS
jgi:hypothetical protein